MYKANEDIIYIVNDKKHNFMVLSMDELLQMTGMLGELVKPEILDLSIKTEALPEEILEGYPCNQVRITTDYTMKIKLVNIKKTMIFHEEKEISGTTEIPGLYEINPEFLQKDFKTGIPNLDEMIQKEVDKQKKIGFPLKVVTHSTQKNEEGEIIGKKTTTMTVSKIKSKNFSGAFFEIPANYDRGDGPWE